MDMTKAGNPWVLSVLVPSGDVEPVDAPPLPPMPPRPPTGKQRCLVPTCNGRRQVRGLCNGCWMYVRRKLSIGETTLPKLEARGALLPVRDYTFRSAGRPSRMAVERARWFGV